MTRTWAASARGATGLGGLIVSADFKPHQPIDFIASRRQKDHRDSGKPSDFPTLVKSIAIWQSRLQDDGKEVLLLQPAKRWLTKR